MQTGTWLTPYCTQAGCSPAAGRVKRPPNKGTISLLFYINVVSSTDHLNLCLSTILFYWYKVRNSTLLIGCVVPDFILTLIRSRKLVCKLYLIWSLKFRKSYYRKYNDINVKQQSIFILSVIRNCLNTAAISSSVYFRSSNNIRHL